MSKFSCYGCTKRHAACHATCEIYKKEKAAHEAEKEKELQQKKIRQGLNDQKCEAIRRIKERSRRKWNGKEGRYSEQN